MSSVHPPNSYYWLASSSILPPFFSYWFVIKDFVLTNEKDKYPDSWIIFYLSELFNKQCNLIIEDKHYLSSLFACLSLFLWNSHRLLSYVLYQSTGIWRPIKSLFFFVCFLTYNYLHCSFLGHKAGFLIHSLNSLAMLCILYLYICIRWLAELLLESGYISKGS